MTSKNDEVFFFCKEENLWLLSSPTLYLCIINQHSDHEAQRYKTLEKNVKKIEIDSNSDLYKFMMKQNLDEN